MIKIHLSILRLKWAALISAIVVGLVAGLHGCGSRESTVQLGNRTGVLHFGNGAEPGSLDPHLISGKAGSNVVGALFEGLVRENPSTLEPETGVAQSWTFSEDGLEATFLLNPDATWSNGDPVTAEDFVWSLRRALHPNMGSIFADLFFAIKNARLYYTGKITDPEELGIEVLGERILRFTLEHPDPVLLRALATPAAYPVHRATVEKHGSATDRANYWANHLETYVSNGPFKLAEWERHHTIKVERRDSYRHAAEVKLNAIVFHPIDNQLTAERMFRTGRLHVTTAVPLNKVKDYSELPESPYRQVPLLSNTFFLLNTTYSPLDDARVRRALALSIDRQSLVDQVLQGVGLASYTITPATVKGYEPPVNIYYDVAQARQLLAEAGYAGGNGWPGLELLYNTSETNRNVVLAVRQMWKDALNIDVTLVNQEWGVYLSSMDSMNYQIARSSNFASFRPSDMLVTFSSNISGLNRTGFFSERYDTILQALLPWELDAGKRQSLLGEAEEIITEAMPAIPIYTPAGKYLVQPSVKGMPLNAAERFNFKAVSLKADAEVWRWPD